MIKKFRKLKEVTTTSPSGRYTEYYTFLIAYDDQKINQELNELATSMEPIARDTEIRFSLYTTT